LSVDRHLTAQKVDPIEGEAEALTLAHSSARCQDHECSVSSRDLYDESLYDLGRQGLDPSNLRLRKLDPNCGTSRDESIGDRSAQDRHDVPIDEFDRCRLEDLFAGAYPRLQFGRSNRCKWSVAKVGKHVYAKIRLDLGRGTGPMNLDCSPSLCVVSERYAARRGIDVSAAELGMIDADKELLRISLARKVLRSRPAVWVAIASPPRAILLSRDKAHEESSSHSIRSRVRDYDR
jgi:hypothetical protein